MKIAMLVRQFSPHGGLELYAHKLVEGLLSRDVAVTVVCQENTSELQHKNLKFKIFEAEKRKESKFLRIKNLFAYANKALSELGREQIDLIHSQHCPTSVADLVTFHNHSTKRLSEVGLWWEAALNDSKRRLVPAYKLRDEQDEILLRNAKCLIFPAEVMKEDFYSAYPFLQGPPAKPYVVAHPGAAMQGGAVSQIGSGSGSVPQSNGFNFLFVGRGFRKKGLDILFSACKILKAKTEQPFTLSIAGLSAKPADKLRLNLLGLQSTVKYLGFQKDMDAVYAAARAIILPSRVEPFGMAPVQAMQRGLVPIVSRVSGVAEVLHDGEDAMILQNHLDANELAGLMLRLMTDGEFLKRLSSQSRETAQKVSWDETVTQTMKAYEIALGLKKKG